MLFVFTLIWLAQEPRNYSSIEEKSARPNVLIILTDDQGWGDLGSQGAEGLTTPHLDQMAAEGVRFTHFRVPMAVCTPSRAALLTGRHPMRQGLGRRVIFPFSEHGLPASEVTLAEILRPAGYRTGLVGKWHLGHARSEFHPLEQGFQFWFGVPYSNDMDDHFYKHNGHQAPPLPLWRNREVIEMGPEQRFLTKRFTDEAIRWIEQGGDEPWFLFLAHVMPHRPISVSWEFAGKMPLGLYGDVIHEIDDSVGRLLTKIEEIGQREDTIVIFTSDNGPWHRPSSGPLRGHKNTTFEGGHRVPCVMRWPAVLPAGEVWNTPTSTLDLLPTLATLCGVTHPMGATPDGKAQPISLDGRDLAAWWRGGSSPEVSSFPYYKNERLHAVSWGRWKLRLREESGEILESPELFALQAEDGTPLDVSEAEDLSENHPELVGRLRKEAEAWRTELGEVD